MPQPKSAAILTFDLGFLKALRFRVRYWKSIAETGDTNTPS